MPLQPRPFPKIEAGLPTYLDSNFRDLIDKVNELEQRIKTLEAKP